MKKPPTTTLEVSYGREVNGGTLPVGARTCRIPTSATLHEAINKALSYKPSMADKTEIRIMSRQGSTS